MRNIWMQNHQTGHNMNWREKLIFFDGFEWNHFKFLPAYHCTYICRTDYFLVVCPYCLSREWNKNNFTPLDWNRIGLQSLLKFP